METRSRFVPPLAAGLLLGGALALRYLWPDPDADPSEKALPPMAVSTVVEGPRGPGETAAPTRCKDALEPGKPRTAAWRREKMVRLTERVERLEQKRKAAEGRGDAAEARRLEVEIDRHRARLGKLREETAELAETERAQQGQGQ
ncbi:MAG: hypothetical protein ACXU86_09635 [Archangium sp.]